MLPSLLPSSPLSPSVLKMMWRLFAFLYLLKMPDIPSSTTTFQYLEWCSIFFEQWVKYKPFFFFFLLLIKKKGLYFPAICRTRPCQWLYTSGIYNCLLCPLLYLGSVSSTTWCLAEQSLFFSNCVSHFPLETIEILGPLVLFFRSISISSPGFANFQDILPANPYLECNEVRLYCKCNNNKRWPEADPMRVHFNKLWTSVRF